MNLWERFCAWVRDWWDDITGFTRWCRELDEQNREDGAE